MEGRRDERVWRGGGRVGGPKLMRTCASARSVRGRRFSECEVAKRMSRGTMYSEQQNIDGVRLPATNHKLNVSSLFPRDHFSSLGNRTTRRPHLPLFQDVPEHDVAITDDPLHLQRSGDVQQPLLALASSSSNPGDRDALDDAIKEGELFLFNPA